MMSSHDIIVPHILNSIKLHVCDIMVPHILNSKKLHVCILRLFTFSIIHMAIHRLSITLRVQCHLTIMMSSDDVIGPRLLNMKMLQV